MVEGTYGFWWSRTHYNEGFWAFISDYFHDGWWEFQIFLVWNAQEWRIWTTHLDYFHHGWRKFWILMVWNAPEWKIWTTHLRLFSPWLKKILDFDNLKCPRMKDLNHPSETIFTMVEENCGFLSSEMPQNEGFEPVISDYFYHGWRKFWILMIWNTLKWRIWTIHLRLF